MLLFAGPQVELAQELVHQMTPPTCDFIGSLHLQQVSALLSHCGMFVCNDTGLMHMSAACGARIVAILVPHASASICLSISRLLDSKGRFLVGSERRTDLDHLIA